MLYRRPLKTRVKGHSSYIKSKEFHKSGICLFPWYYGFRKKFQELRTLNIHLKQKIKELPPELNLLICLMKLMIVKSTDTNFQVDTSTVINFSNKSLLGVIHFSFNIINEIDISKSLLSTSH